MTHLRILDLFSGIGGFSLGLERTGGFKTVAFCEIEPFCRRVLAKHWPEVPCYDDVRTLTAERLAADGISIDVICGGFPCQDISVAGRGGGLAGERSGLWSDYARLIGEIRPSYVLVENVAALLGRGLGDVLGDLAALGYDSEWHCIPASAVGAPHRRDRIWIVAYSQRLGRQDIWSERDANDADLRGRHERSGYLQDITCASCGQDVANANSAGFEREGQAQSKGWERNTISPRISENVANPTRELSHWAGPITQQAGRRKPTNRSPYVRDPDREGLAIGQGKRSNARPKLTSVVRADWWLTESDVGRMADGVPSRVDRLRGLGNAVVPQIPELIGRAILQALAS